MAPLFAIPSAGAQTAQQRARCPRIEVAQNVTGTFRRLGDAGVGYYSGGMTAICHAAGLRLTADSAEYHEGQEILYLFGEVRYTESGTSVDARRMTYWRREERI